MDGSPLFLGHHDQGQQACGIGLQARAEEGGFLVHQAEIVGVPDLQTEGKVNLLV